jgi:hypothetical protein
VPERGRRKGMKVRTSRSRRHGPAPDWLVSTAPLAGPDRVVGGCIGDSALLSAVGDKTRPC